MKTMNIGYFADGPWAHRALERILQDPAMTVRFVCARWDAPDPVLRRMATERGLDFLTERSINSDEFLAKMESYGCDIFVSMSFNQIFRKPLFDLPPLKTINCHAGKLPRYRGRNILNWALINDEKEFGVTVHYIDEGIDTGDIISQVCFPISDADDYGTLLQRAYVGCADVLYDALVAIREGRAKRIPQASLAPGFYCSQRKAGDERLHWDQPSRDVFNFVRAISRPGPQARTYLGGREISVNRIELIPHAPAYKGCPGAVVGVAQGSFDVKTSDSFVRVVDWSGVERVKVGDRLE